MPTHTTDYLIIGSGAMGMAFADTLLAESDARVVMIDRHHGPGGHWNDAYPFVRLHQPSAIYGVNSRRLGNDTLEEAGFNAGLPERATAAELVSYYEQLMQGFIRSGRLHYFPMCSYVEERNGQHWFESLLSGERHAVTVHHKLVDSTYFKTAVPSTHPPRYALASTLHCIPPNDLPRRAPGHSGYTVVGAGKTGVDACLWLLENGAAPDAITWIMPRDAWHYNRALVHVAEASVQQWLANTAVADGTADTVTADDGYRDPLAVDAFLLEAERAGLLLRMAPEVKPAMFHGATMTLAELAALQRITKVVRKGRVLGIETTQIHLEHGSIPTDAQQLYIDCTSSAVQQRPPVAVFNGRRITLQMVRWPAATFSAALLAHLEIRFAEDAYKNALSTPTPMPDLPSDWIRLAHTTGTNIQNWFQDPDLQRWILQSRLSGFV